MALEFGLRGLAQRIPFEEYNNDLNNNYVRTKQMQAEQQHKAQLFADDFDYNNAMNEYDNPRVKEFARNQFQKIGEFIRQNPNYERDPNAMLQLKLMRKELKDNPVLNRGLQTDSAIKEFNKDLAEKSKTPQLMDQQAYNDIAQQIQNYKKFGNQYATSAEDVAAKGGEKAFVYQAPKDFVDLSKAGEEYGNKFNDFEVKPLHVDGVQTAVGAHGFVPVDKSVHAVASDMYSLNKRQLDVEAKQRGLPNGYVYAEQLVRAGIKTPPPNFGDFGAMVGFARLHANSGSGVTSEGVWTKDIVQTNKSAVNGELLGKALGKKPQFAFKTDDGKTVIPSSGNEVEYPGYTFYATDADKKAGVKQAVIQTHLTKEQAKDMGILNSKWFGDDAITPEWAGKAKIVKRTNAKGEEVEGVEYTDAVPFNVNSPTFQGIYDQGATINKFQEAPKDEYGEEQITSGSGKYTWNGSSWVPNK